jgi:hypothetical protein
MSCADHIAWPGISTIVTLSIVIPESLEVRLEEEAVHQGIAAPELAVKLLSAALNGEPADASVEDIVARIQATPPNSDNIRPATGSLADALRGCGEEPNLDVTEWNRAYLAVEAEMKSVTRANELAEGRG